MVVSITQVYLPKLYENILKTYRFNLFKEFVNWLQPQFPDDFRISYKSPLRYRPETIFV